ncbi:MAG: hypothetical protein ACREOD_00745 [Candidatus Dormibacteria bacterium]
MSFKGVLLEGMEVVMIVLTLGLSSGHLVIASLAAVAAVVIVAGVGSPCPASSARCRRTP